MARYGGTIPSKNRAFTTLVDPVSPPLVEAPGTAPGSDTLMPRGVYRHSRLPDTTNISVRRAFLKAATAPRISPWQAEPSAHRVRRQRRTTNDAPLHRPAGRDRP